MFQKIKIKNFQSHNDLELPLGKITVIVGATDKGKSSIYRALDALCTNTYTGETYVTWGKSNFEVSLYKDDNNYVKLTKGDKNRYELVTSEGKEMFDRIGKTVPEKVLDFLGMYFLEVDKDFIVRVNFHSQDDRHFLLYESGYRQAKLVGCLTFLNDIFLALKESSGDLKKAGLVIEKLKEEIKQKAEELKQYEHLENWDIILSKVEEEIKKYRVRLDRWDTIKKLKEELEVRIKRIGEVSGQIDRLSVVNINISGMQDKINRIRELSMLEQSIKETEDSISNKQRVLNRLAGIEHISIDGLKDKVTKLNELKVIQDRMWEDMDFTEHRQDKLNEKVKEVDLISIKMQKALESIDKCPMCEMDLDHEHRDKLVRK